MKFADSVALRIAGLDDPPRLYLHGERDRHVSRRIRQEGVWEPYETSLVLALLHPGDVFVDVGANLGYFSVVAARAVGERGRVYAFEPDPANFNLLRANTELNAMQQSICCVRAGLSDDDGDGLLYLSEDNLGDHQLFAQPGRHSVPVSLLHGGRYLGARLRRLDMVKIDTQGAEYAVLAGLMPWLMTLEQAPHILVELTPLSLRQAGASGRALIELLAILKQPFWIVDHIEHRLLGHSAQELAQWCDDVDRVEGDAGFMNILVGSRP